MFHDAIEMSPSMATYGYDLLINFDTELTEQTPPTVTDWMVRLKDNHILAKLQLDWTADQMEKYADRKHRHIEIQVGDLVFLNYQNIPTKRPSRRLDWKEVGPFLISEKKQFCYIPFQSTTIIWEHTQHVPCFIAIKEKTK